ncbi:hypothetical protein J437_LFUL002708 [Ladona fulva]|uniref:F-box protein n=1 Tax=Ladona fulva TaxID=123851 RepID=A0A8K0JUM7_LADFU|nr:hypothetical protein J437_LFUL002708 [Ladona fulva]
MGNSASEEYIPPVTPSGECGRDENIPSTNGFLFSEYYLPPEVVIQILFYVDAETLKNSCRLVCKDWQYLVETYVFRYKASLDLKIGSPALQKFTWFDYYSLASRKPFGKNLLKNNCGKDKFIGWKILENGGDGWIVEKKPYGANDLPLDTFGNPIADFNGLKSCFATSYMPCRKSQLIELKSCGITPNIMDYVQPKIEISEWVACRFDCGSVYKLKVILRGESGEILQESSAEENFDEHPREIWKKVCILNHFPYIYATLCK